MSEKSCENCGNAPKCEKDADFQGECHGTTSWKPKEQEWVEHIVKEGARFHVLSYDSFGVHCSEPNCEINKPKEKESKLNADETFKMLGFLPIKEQEPEVIECPHTDTLTCLACDKTKYKCMKKQEEVRIISRVGNPLNHDEIIKPKEQEPDLPKNCNECNVAKGCDLCKTCKLNEQEPEQVKTCEDCDLLALDNEQSPCRVCTPEILSQWRNNSNDWTTIYKQEPQQEIDIDRIFHREEPKLDEQKELIKMVEEIQNSKSVYISAGIILKKKLEWRKEWEEKMGIANIKRGQNGL